MKRKTLAIGLLAQLLLVCGCGSPPKDLSGQTLPPIQSDQVILYANKPGSYDIVGMIKLPLTPDLTWDEDGRANKAFDLMKAKAAAMGANGVLLKLDKSEYDMLATAGYGTTMYQVPILLKPQRPIVARAILVKSD